MDASFFSTLKTEFNDFVSSPLAFLEGNSDISEELRDECKALYDFYKISQGSSKPDPVPRLILEGFDDEQIWGQIELLNKKEASVCLKATDILISNEDDITFQERVSENLPEDEENIVVDDESSEDEDLIKIQKMDEESGSEDGFHFEESDDSDLGEDAEEEDDQAGDKHEENFERTEVDDDFFSLRKMEKFLDEEDKKFDLEKKKPTEGDIDYFEAYVSDDEYLRYDDYFDAPLRTDVSTGKNIKSSSLASTGLSPLRTDVSTARNIKSSSLAPTGLSKVDETTNEMQSTFQKHRQKILKKIEVLEDKALAPADWQLKGEVKGTSRPENSLLQETVQFDQVSRPPAEITEEHTKNLEDVIKQRVLDGAWDDVEKKYKPERDAVEYKKRIVLDSSQSKLTLSEIYEKEYLEKTQKIGKKDEDEKESEEHVSIRKDIEHLFRKLDALSNFHFIAPPPEPEIKLITNVPSIAKEEVQPVGHAESQLLAPEEVFSKSTGGEEKSAQEKSSTDKKRERRKKKLRMKARANAKLEKLKKLDPESEKVKKLEAINQLKRAAKAPGSNTTIVQGKAKTDSKLTSQKFFSKLQQKETSTTHARQKR